jgi:hypothetical protein
MLFVADGSHGPEPAFCSLGGPQDEVDDVLYPDCVALPGWVSGSGDVQISFVVHGENPDAVLFLDDVEVTGRGGGCYGPTLTVLEEDFGDQTACDTGRWTFSDSTWSCPGFDCAAEPGWSPGVQVEAERVSLETSVDASSLDEEVRACFRFGYDGTGPGGSLVFEFDAGNGYEVAWSQQGRLGPNGECREVCVSLSGIDPLVHNHPELGLRFSLDAGSGRIVLYHVSLTGVSRCPATGAEVVLSSLVPAGGGEYGFGCVNVGSSQLTAWTTCWWDPDPDIRAVSRVTFRP